MIQVWCSNRLESLAGRLIDNLRDRGSSPVTRLFAVPPIVVPNRNIETYLKYEIARGAGVAAGLVFHVPEIFLGELLCEKQEGTSRAKLLHQGALRAFFIEVLSEPSSSAETGLLPEPVRVYLESAGDDPEALDRRRFQLAARLARLVHHYGDACPELMRRWSSGGAMTTNGPTASTEAWQHSLWMQLLSARDRARAERGTAWVLPWQSLEHLDPAMLKRPGGVHLFGFSYFTCAQLELIAQLDRHTTLNIYTFTPCNWYQDNPPAPGSRGPARRTRGRPVASEPEEHSIVDLWGAPGRDCAHALGQLAGATFDTQFISGEATTVLGRLQNEILHRAPEADRTFEPDESLVILGCPGIRREAEIIANEIWRLIHQDDRGPAGRSPERLRFRDFAVLIADSANRAAYQAHFRAVLEELHNIPYNMVDLPLAGECYVIEGVLLLLSLPLGEFTRPELLKILGHRALRARFRDADPDRWRGWCLELEVVRGADRSDHDGTYIDVDLFHWEQALRRLVLGAFMTGPFHGDERWFSMDGSDYLPYEVPPDALADAALLLLLARSLVADARFARKATLTLTEWSEFFLRMVGAYLGADSVTEQRALSLCRREIHSLRNLDVSGRRVGYVTAWDSLRQAIEGLAGERGHYLVDGVVLSPLKEMRALPFRVIFLCGLGEGRFPATEGPDPLDVTATDRRDGAVSPRERDRYLFLETLACARERLYLSYVSRDPQTRDPLNPASVLGELMRYLRWKSDAEPFKQLLNQPLRRFDDSYFSNREERPFPAAAAANYSTQARREWQARSLRRSLGNQSKGLLPLRRQSLRRLDPGLAAWLGLCPLRAAASGASASDRVTLSFSDLRRFLECPLQGWAAAMLRLAEDDEIDEAAREDEPFTTGALRETTLLREIFFEGLKRGVAGGDRTTLEALYRPRAQYYSQHGWMPVGLFREAETDRHLDCLSAWYEEARANNLVGHGFCVYRFGSAREAERVERIESAIALDVGIPGPAGETRSVRVDLVGRTEIVAPRLPVSIFPVLRSEPRAKDFLRGFLDAVVLSLLPGHHDPAEFHTHVIAAARTHNPRKAVRTFRNIDALRARRFLTDVVADLLAGPHEYLLPCEAVFDFLNPKNSKSIAQIVELMKEADHSSCSSRYGQVPDFTRYEPPDEDQARQLVERRFGLFRDSGGMDE
jgi:exodeoxyribonuclease V gamma subunit